MEQTEIMQKPINIIHPKCEVCGKDRPMVHLNAEGTEVLSVDNQDPYAEIITCREHREYQFIKNLSLVKALAGYGDGEWSEEALEDMRKHISESKQEFKDMLLLVKDVVPQPHTDKILNYIERLGYIYAER